MSYTKPNQAAFADQLRDYEYVVQLSEGDYVAVGAVSSVEPNTGNTVMLSTARAVEADGSQKFDANGQAIVTHFNFSCDMDGINAIGGMSEFRRKMLLTVLGEDAEWPNPPATDVLNHTSIRTSLAAAEASGPVEDIDDIL
jgi:hypothetical protein